MPAPTHTPVHPDVLLLFGTQTGNAETVAYAMAQTLEAAGFTAHLLDMADAYPELLADYHQLMVCISTWGEGELPDNAYDLYEGLAAVQPDLAHLAFGIVALGDHYYDPHFCEAGRLMATQLIEAGATAVYPMLEIDTGPTDQDLAAAEDWTRACATAFEAYLAAQTPQI